MTTTRPFLLERPQDPARPLRGRLTVPDGFTDSSSVPYAIVLHGFKGFMDWGFFPELARRFAHAGIAVINFNVSGSGVGEDLMTFSDPEGFAKNTYSRELEDVAQVRAAVLTGAFPGLDPERAALLGHSRGGGVALLHAAEDGRYRALVTWAAIDDVDRFDEDTKSMWRDTGHVWIPNARTGEPHRIDLDLLEDCERHRGRLDIRAACRRCPVPTLLIHGSADTAVDPSALASLGSAFEPGRARTLEIEGAGHTFDVGHPFEAPSVAFSEATEASIDFVLGYLSGF